jgi:phenylpropionate dioxygenase-like ring-hydroxylating dioxygenase large terminal subunit
MQYTNQQIADLVRDDCVHKSVYTDPDLFQLEMERIYGHAWIYVGHESQVPKVGDFYATRIGDQDVIMTRDADQTVNVMYNRCPHKGAQLVPAES